MTEQAFVRCFDLDIDIAMFVAVSYFFEEVLLSRRLTDEDICQIHPLFPTYKTPTTPDSER
jgi:hypothetical protein